MTTPIQSVQSEYRNLPLDSLTESAMNPRRNFDAAALSELAESIKTQGILAPLVVRPVNNHFEIVAGARRYRAARLAGFETAPVRIVELTDAQALETSIVENLQRRDVHPLEEAQGFAALLKLEEPKYSVEQIAAKCAKSAAYVLARVRLTELVPAVTEAFLKDEIGTGHALLLAKLQKEQQEEALTACYQESYGSSNKTKRILLPVRQLQQWIEHNILLELASAPFSKKDAQLVPEAGACHDCPKRTGHNTLLFEGMAALHDSCSDPKCYAAKLEAHVQQTIVAKPKLVQISTAYGPAKEGSAVVPRNKYVEIRSEKPKNEKQRDWPEYKTCKFTTEAIVTEGSEKGELRRVCANPDCPVHHARKQPTKADAVNKAEQEQRRREEAIAQTTGLRVLSAITAAVPVRLMKRDFLFVVEHLAAMLDERRLAIVLRQHSISKSKATAADTPSKLLAAFIRKADESTLGHLLVEIVILHSTHSPTDSGKPVKVLVIGLPRAGKTTYLAAFWHLLLSDEVVDSLQMAELQPSREHLNNITALWRQWKNIPRTTLPKERVVTINLTIPGSADDYELAVPDASGEAFRRIFETRRCSADFELLASEAEAVMLFIHPSQAIPPQTIDAKVDALADLIDSAFDDHDTTGALGEETIRVTEPPMQDEAAEPELLKFTPKYATYQSKLVDLLQISRSYRGAKPQKLAVVISAWDLCEVEGLTPEKWLQERLPLLHQYLNTNDDVCSFDIFGISAQGAELKAPGTLVDAIRASDRIKVVHNGLKSKDLTLPIRYVLTKSEAFD